MRRARAIREAAKASKCRPQAVRMVKANTMQDTRSKRHFLCLLLGQALAVPCAAAQTVQDILSMYDAVEAETTIGVSAKSARLRNPVTNYFLRALDRAPAKYSPLGMQEPITANFYYGGFMLIRVGGVATGAHVPRLAAGKCQGIECVNAVWELADDTITASFTLLPNASGLFVNVSSTRSTKEKLPFYVRLGAYPQSFNRAKHGTPRANFAILSGGERIEASASKSLGGGLRWIYLGDSLYKGTQGGAAVGFAPGSLTNVTAHVGNYHVRIDLLGKPADSLQFFLVDYGLCEVGGSGKEVAALLEGDTAIFDRWRTGGAGR